MKWLLSQDFFFHINSLSSVQWCASQSWRWKREKAKQLPKTQRSADSARQTGKTWKETVKRSQSLSLWKMPLLTKMTMTDVSEFRWLSEACACVCAAAVRSSGTVSVFLWCCCFRSGMYETPNPNLHGRWWHGQGGRVMGAGTCWAGSAIKNPCITPNDTKLVCLNDFLQWLGLHAPGRCGPWGLEGLAAPSRLRQGVGAVEAAASSAAPQARQM